MLWTRCLYAATAFAAVTLQASASTGPSRLREHNIDFELLGRELPVDPDGKDGPKRVSGYFALNRTEARSIL